MFIHGKCCWFSNPAFLLLRFLEILETLSSPYQLVKASHFWRINSTCTEVDFPPSPIGVKRTSSHKWIKPQVEANFDVKHRVDSNPRLNLDPCPRDSKTNAASRKQLLTLGLKNLFRIPSSPYLLYCIPLCIPSNVHPYDSINSIIPSSNSVNTKAPWTLHESTNTQSSRTERYTSVAPSGQESEISKAPAVEMCCFFQSSQSNRTCTYNTFLKSKCWFTRMNKIIENKIYSEKIQAGSQKGFCIFLWACILESQNSKKNEFFFSRTWRFSSLLLAAAAP